MYLEGTLSISRKKTNFQYFYGDWDIAQYEEWCVVGVVQGIELLKVALKCCSNSALLLLLQYDVIWVERSESVCQIVKASQDVMTAGPIKQIKRCGTKIKLNASASHQCFLHLNSGHVRNLCVSGCCCFFPMSFLSFSLIRWMVRPPSSPDKKAPFPPVQATFSNSFLALTIWTIRGAI